MDLLSLFTNLLIFRIYDLYVATLPLLFLAKVITKIIGVVQFADWIVHGVICAMRIGKFYALSRQ